MHIFNNKTYINLISNKNQLYFYLLFVVSISEIASSRGCLESN